MERTQPQPGSYQFERVKILLSEFDKECLRQHPEPKGYRMISDCNGYPMPVYDNPAIKVK